MTDIYKFCNKLVCGCGIESMKQLPDACIPLTVTSPPFDDLRLFGGHSFHFEPMARELWRVTAEGGVVCWHVQEQIKNGSETGTSSEQRLYFRDLGFRLHHTMVVETVAGHVSSDVRYGSALQYLFVLSKGKPRTFNPIKDVPNKLDGQRTGFRQRHSDGSTRNRRQVVIGPTRMRGVVWQLYPGSHNSDDREALAHPALMHEGLARDLIRSWSRPGELVLDLMGGAASTAVAALEEGRHFLSFEVFPEYHELAVARLEKTWERMKQKVKVAS